MSPAYEDHLSSNFGSIVNAPHSNSNFTASSSPRPVVQHYQPEQANNAAMTSKAQYAAQLREQMRSNEEKKLRQKREQQEYDAKYDSPPKPIQNQQLMSPDEYVDGPFGRRRLGGGGDPGGVADLKKRSNLIRQISNEEAYDPAPIYENAPEPPTPAGANAATRQKMVADVYGATGTGAALGFAPGRQNNRVQRPADPQPPSFHSFTNPNPPDARKLSAAEMQRNALQQQIEEKRRKKAEEEAREKEEDAKEWMRIQMENERLKAEEEEVKRKKQEQEQENLELLQAQQEAAALKRMNRKNVEQSAAPAALAVAAAPPSARGTIPSHRSPLPSAREPTPHTSRSNAPPSTLRETQQLAMMDKVMSQRSPPPKVGAPGLRPGDFFTIDPNEMMRESSPFTKNMELLRSSVEEDYSQPLTEFQNRFKSDVDRFSRDVRPPPSWDSSSRPPVYSGENDVASSEDRLEQSLRADSQFHAVGQDAMPFGQTMMGGGGGQPEENAAALSGDGGATEVDLSDAFVQQWQNDNGFSSTTGGYAPHRKLLHSARDQGKLPNFRALNAMNSKRNFASGTKETMAGMASTAAPPVNPNDALRRTMMPQGGYNEGGDGGMTSKSHFFSEDVANVAEVFGAADVTTATRSRNDPAEMSLKSESLLMYIRGPESSRGKEAARFGRELQTVGEAVVEAEAAGGLGEAGEMGDGLGGGATEASIEDDSGPTSEQFGRSGFVVREQRDVVRVEDNERGGRYQLDYEDDFADDGFEDENDLNEDEVLVIAGSSSGSGSGGMAIGEGGGFSVKSVTDEERELMMDQQRSKWGQPEHSDDIRSKMEEVVQDKPQGAGDSLTRSNSELDVLVKLKRMEEDLGVGSNVKEDSGEEVDEDVQSSSGEEEVEVVEEEEEAKDGGSRRKSFTEKWLGVGGERGAEAEGEDKTRAKINAELIFVERGGGEGKAEEVEDEEGEEEYTDDEDDGEISPPSSPVKQKRSEEVVSEEVVSEGVVSEEVVSSDDEDEISPPSSPNKALNQSDPGLGAGDLSPVDKKIVEDLVNSYIKTGLKDLESEDEEDDVALGAALLRVKNKVDQSVEVE